jgi:hypothetical protein
MGHRHHPGHLPSVEDVHVDPLPAARPLAALGLAPGLSSPGRQRRLHRGPGPDPQGAPITVGIWYPADAAAKPMPLGIGDQVVATGAPLVGDHLPLIVMSHGNGGFFGGHADTAQALAEAGFVVAALTHTGDNYADQSRATDMANRPRQLSVLIDYMLKASPMQAAIDPDRVGAFGFSSGGFTVLVAAGGEPDLTTMTAHCKAHPDFFDCKLTAAHPFPADVTRALDPRRADQGRGLGRPGHRLQLLQGGPVEGDHAAAAVAGRERPDPARPVLRLGVRANLPKAPEYHVVAKAGHFDFLTPCNDMGRATAAAICSSAPGFDRAAFHRISTPRSWGSSRPTWRGLK